MSKPYMPLMMGDWLRGTRGMRAEVRGVYINLLIHQFDHGYLPSDMETLSLIDPEVSKVWVSLKDKFLEVEPGKLQNKKLEEVRSFWEKQGSNGKKGGRPKKDNPNSNPKPNPSDIPKPNLHNDLDLDNELSLKNKKEPVSKLEISCAIFADELYVENLTRLFPKKNLQEAFDKCWMYHSVKPSPPEELWEWKQKLGSWLENTKEKQHVNGNTPTRTPQPSTTIIETGKSFGIEKGFSRSGADGRRN